MTTEYKVDVAEFLHYMEFCADMLINMVPTA